MLSLLQQLTSDKESGGALPPRAEFITERPDARASFLEAGVLTLDDDGSTIVPKVGKDRLLGFEVQRLVEHLNQPPVSKSGLLLQTELLADVRRALGGKRMGFALRDRLQRYVVEIDAAIAAGECPLGFTPDSAKRNAKNASLLFAWRHIMCAATVLNATPLDRDYPEHLFHQRRLADDLVKTTELVRSYLANATGSTKGKGGYGQGGGRNKQKGRGKGNPQQRNKQGNKSMNKQPHSGNAGQKSGGPPADKATPAKNA